MQSKLLLKNRDFLRELLRVNSKKRKVLLKHVNDSLVQCLSECCLNVVRNNVPITEQRLKSLRKHKDSIRKLADKKLQLKQRKRLIIQKGSGFIVPLLAALAPVFGSLLFGRS